MTRRESAERRYRKALGIAFALSVGVHAILLATGKLTVEDFTGIDRAVMERNAEEVPNNWEDRPLRMVQLKAPAPEETRTTEATSTPIGPAAQSEAAGGAPSAEARPVASAAPARTAEFTPVMRPVAVLETVEPTRRAVELPRVERTSKADPAVLAFRARMERQEEQRVSWRAGSEAARQASRGGVWNESGAGRSGSRGGFVLVGGGGGGHCASGGIGAVNRRGPGLIGARSGLGGIATPGFNGGIGIR